MMDLPFSREMTIAVPQAMQRYFYELVAGGACVVVSTITALWMLLQVMGSGDTPEWLRMIYFLVIALALVLLLTGIKIVMDSEQERRLAAPHKNNEWRMDLLHLTISLVLLEGKERGILRRFKTGAVRIEWQDITKMVLDNGSGAPKARPACYAIHVENHEQTLGYNAVLYVRRDLLAKQEQQVLAFCKRQGVTIEEAA